VLIKDNVKKILGKFSRRVGPLSCKTDGSRRKQICILVAQEKNCVSARFSQVKHRTEKIVYEFLDLGLYVKHIYIYQH